MSDEIKALHELITTVRLDIRELNTKMDNIKDLTKKVTDVETTANKALNLATLADKRVSSIEDNQKWLWRTVVSGLILSAIGMYVKLKVGV